MKVLCSKDYCGSITLYRDSNTEKHHPVQLIKGTYYDVLPTLGGYIIGYTQDISFFRDSEWFEQYFNPKTTVKIDTLESKDVTLDEQAIESEDTQAEDIFLDNTEDIKEKMLKDYDKFFTLNEHTIKRLIELGVLKTDIHSCRDNHVGKSDYSHKIIQPWTLWMEYKLNAWDADIVKRILRTKEEAGMSPEEARKMDYEKIIHDSQERIRQLDIEIQSKINKKSNEN